MKMHAKSTLFQCLDLNFTRNANFKASKSKRLTTKIWKIQYLNYLVNRNCILFRWRQRIRSKSALKHWWIFALHFISDKLTRYQTKLQVQCYCEPKGSTRTNVLWNRVWRVYIIMGVYNGSQANIWKWCNWWINVFRKAREFAIETRLAILSRIMSSSVTGQVDKCALGAIFLKQ